MSELLPAYDIAERIVTHSLPIAGRKAVTCDEELLREYIALAIIQDRDLRTASSDVAGWQDIETAPIDTVVLVAGTGKHGPFVTDAKRDKDGNWYLFDPVSDGYFADFDAPTLWRTLPLPHRPPRHATPLTDEEPAQMRGETNRRCR